MCERCIVHSFTSLDRHSLRFGWSVGFMKRNIFLFPPNDCGFSFSTDTSESLECCLGSRLHIVGFNQNVQARAHVCVCVCSRLVEGWSGHSSGYWGKVPLLFPPNFASVADLLDSSGDHSVVDRMLSQHHELFITPFESH